MQGPELGLLGDTRSSRVDMCGVVGVNGDPPHFPEKSLSPRSVLFGLMLVCTLLTVVVMALLVTVSNTYWALTKR